MQGSVLTYSGNPSSTFTSLYESIFSDFSYAVANTIAACDSPFSYLFNKNYRVTVLFCALMAFQGNQIVINYPYYPTTLGAGFPFSQMLNYAVQDSNGNLIAYRTESNAKTAMSSCTTASVNSYNYGEVTKQQLNFSITLLSPITLSPNTYSSFAVVLTLPTAISVSFVSCQIDEVLLGMSLGCSLVNSTAQQVSLVATYIGTNAISVISLRTIVTVVAVGATVSPITTYYYSVNVIMPQTDISALPVYYGSLYAPYSSTIATCSSILSLLSVAATGQSIVLANLHVRAIGLSFIC